MNHNPNDADHRRLFLAVFLAASVLMGWQYFIQAPRHQQLEVTQAELAKKRQQEQLAYAKTLNTKELDTDENPALTRDQRLVISPRVTIKSDKLHGSISLKGARFDDITLAGYRETLDPSSPEVILFSPNGDDEAYFAQIGWVATDGSTKVPDQHSLWQADRKSLVPNETLNLKWNNGEGVTFLLAITLDDQYMFSVAQRVENSSGKVIEVSPFGYVNRIFDNTPPKHGEAPKHNQSVDNTIMHLGPIGVIGGSLTEISYKDLREKGNKVFEANTSGWAGITDKYWLASLIPTKNYKITFSHYLKSGKERYQADYLSEAQKVETGSAGDYSTRLFAGAKELKILDKYSVGDAKTGAAPIPLFDRAVDFGVLYFMTKPMFMLLNFFFEKIGNFGLAIMLLTIVVKLCLYPLANKAYIATARMRDLQPQMVALKEKYFDDKIKLQQETLALYKREKVNPASGCLPLLIQMPVFFALYKVLFVTIEMRHAPFFGWIKDLSAPDPSNIFTAFGLIQWNTPYFLHIGILPILYCASMVIQMGMQPTPTDPIQARTMKFMPYFLLIIFASFSAGLVLYWVWSNVLSIVQQKVIELRQRKLLAKKTKAA